MPALLGRKIGMTRFFDAEGVNVPATVIEAGPCFVTQVKSAETDGYDAVQIGFEDLPAHRSTMPLIGHDAKAGVTPKRFHREFRTEGDENDYEVGQRLTVSDLVMDGVFFVDVTGTSKGKGFQGVMKRHNFAGQEASHGVERKHRSPGSLAGGGINLGTGPKLKKGRRMAGHMGHETVTVRNLDVVHVDADRNLLLVKGPVPGPNRGVLYVRPSARLGRRKQNIADEKAKA